MPVVTVLAAVVMIGASGFWAWDLQRRLRVLVHRDTARDAAQESPAALEVVAPTPTPVVPDLATLPAALVRLVATAQVDPSPPLSPSAWGRMTVISIVAIDGTAILACRPCGGDSARRLSRRPHRFRSRSPRPNLLATDETLVLEIGDDAASLRGWALLEHWRRDSTLLSLRPGDVSGTITLSEGNRCTMRVRLLAG